MANQSDLQDENAALKAQLKRLAAAAAPMGVVIKMNDSKAVVCTGCGPNLEVLRPSFSCELGDTVTLHPESMQIGSVSKLKLPGGVMKVHEILDGGYVEIEGSDHHKVVVIGPNVEKVQKGCKVMLDSTGHIILANLGRPAGEFQRGETGIEWAEIGGLEDVKRQVIEGVEHPHLYPDLYASYGQKPPKGYALVGPPGNGKTMIGKATATSLARIYNKAYSGKLSSTAFLYVKGPEILNKWVGESETRIRDIFERAREHKREHGHPAVIFIDEAESILAKRGSGVSSDMEKTIVPSFLAEMDGMDDSSAIVILATNRPTLIDPAVLRDGRIDRKLYVGRPDGKASETILRLYLKKATLASRVTAGDLAEVALEAIYSDSRFLGEYGTKGAKLTLYLRNLISGAMLKNVVDMAVASAIRRDIGAGKTKKGSGVNEQDIIFAVDSVQEHAAHLNHDDVLDELKEQQEQVKKPQVPQRTPITAVAG